ncbi:unnamed protein product, partial [marine sediment metagenome]
NIHLGLLKHHAVYVYLRSLPTDTTRNLSNVRVRCTVGDEPYPSWVDDDAATARLKVSERYEIGSQGKKTILYKYGLGGATTQ